MAIALQQLEQRFFEENQLYANIKLLVQLNMSQESMLMENLINAVCNNGIFGGKTNRGLCKNQLCSVNRMGADKQDSIYSPTGKF